MNILELCLSKSLGGLELYFYKTSMMLDQYHSVVTIIRTGSRLEKSITAHTKNHRPMKCRTLIFRFLQLKKLISKEDIDIVHIHHKDDLPLCVMVKFFSKKKFKLVHTRQMALPRKKKDIYHRFIYGQIDLLLVITKQLYISAIRNLPIHPDKIKLLHYGVSVSEAGNNPFSKEERTFFKVGIFSRIGFKKGHHILLEALHMLGTEPYEILVHIYGDVMDVQYFEALNAYISQKNLNHVFFKGFIENPQSIMGHFDVVVVPSLNETFGLVAVEAMLMKTAVIASNGGGLCEIIEHETTGLLFETASARDLAAQIRRLVEYPDLRAKLAAKGKLSAEKKFDEQVHYMKLAKLMEQAKNQTTSEKRYD